MKVLELFSGVGGYHIALRTLFPGIRLDVRAYDNNQTALQTYELNLDATVQKANIEHLRGNDVDGFDLWAMSPPCQPHTNTSMSLQRDSSDKRSTPFTHICNLLEDVLNPPEYIICENVPGFVSSAQFERFRAALRYREYDWQVCNQPAIRSLLTKLFPTYSPFIAQNIFVLCVQSAHPRQELS